MTGGKRCISLFASTMLHVEVSVTELSRRIKPVRPMKTSGNQLQVVRACSDRTTALPKAEGVFYTVSITGELIS
jgi:hypothetical protein